MSTIREQIANGCRHFNGVQNGQCKAGVYYDQVSATRALPCLRNLGEHVPCSHRSWLTPEEVEVEASKEEAYGAMFLKTIPLISRIKREHKGKAWQGVEVCPVCAGKLHMRHSGYNGHVWGRCETKDCLAWTE